MFSRTLVSDFTNFLKVHLVAKRPKEKSLMFGFVPIIFIPRYFKEIVHLDKTDINRLM